MVCKTYCATCIGVKAVTVTIEVDVTRGVGLHIVGLPDSAVKESILRVSSALKSYGYRIPGKRIVINLAPADIKKQGSSFDLAIAMATLSATEQISIQNMESYIIMGELSLDGAVRGISGALPIAVHASKLGFKACIMPRESAMEAVENDGINVFGVNTISDVIDILTGNGSEFLIKRSNRTEYHPKSGIDFADIKGQDGAKRGLEIAAAGGHNVILVGAPGCGKSLMASALPSILPPMTKQESIETSTIYSVAGKSIGRYGLLKERPFRTPHNSASRVALIGGGIDALPGEISLAHNGVLFLDEIAQFSKNTLDLLRQPLEDGYLSISRAKYRIDYPCSFMLIASMNPCPCGYHGDKSGRCKCSPSSIANYMSRVSGPMMDRIDIHICVDRVSSESLLSNHRAESSAEIARRVHRAREIQYKRFESDTIFTNARMNVSQLNRYCALSDKDNRLLSSVIDKLHLSARAYGKILKLARTIADLYGFENIDYNCISEAIQFRNLDRY